MRCKTPSDRPPVSGVVSGLCDVLGWGSLAFFHDAYGYRGDLVRLGHIDGPIDPLPVRGTFPPTLERAG